MLLLLDAIVGFSLLISSSIAGIIFILSSGLLFQKKFRDSVFLGVVAGALAFVAMTYFLAEQIMGRERAEERVHQARDVVVEYTQLAWDAVGRVMVRVTRDSEMGDGDGGKATHDQTATPVPPRTGNVPSGGGNATPAAGKTGDRRSTASADSSFVDCEDCPRMVMVPAGHYRMGSPKTEPGHQTSEEPLTDITIAKPFAIGQFKVTFTQWDACVTAHACKYRPGDSGWGRDDRPVLNVSWDDAHDYIAWLRTITKKHYRLPSEAEWEYAARAGTESPYFWGNDISPLQANYNNPDGTVPVGMFPKNGFALYQVHGNLGEWVEDCWRDSLARIPHDGSPYRSDNCEKHVVRAGYWAYGPERIRAASRGAGDGRSPLFGFRVALDP